ncbi:hypothetical protein M9Y10_045809 [Tritrichomonas musculus]|uniref:Uncharacterized protein n=1 Tax=Tritrichomonas musculus TaxID=1915356 RepID=A0ABR2JXI4_9EUKA
MYSSLSDSNQITLALGSSFNKTKEILQHAVSNGNQIIQSSSIRELKRNESSILLEAAQLLYTSANHFLSQSNSYENTSSNERQNVIDQMAETNSNLESTFAAFNELVNRNTSPRSVSVSSFINAATPLLPGILYYSFRKIGNYISETENNRRLAIEMKQREANEDFLMMSDPYF